MEEITVNVGIRELRVMYRLRPARESAAASADEVWVSTDTQVSACIIIAEGHAALAAARRAGRIDLAAHHRLADEFASGDRRQCDAASALGLTVAVI